MYPEQIIFKNLRFLVDHCNHALIRRFNKLTQLEVTEGGRRYAANVSAELTPRGSVASCFLSSGENRTLQRGPVERKHRAEGRPGGRSPALLLTRRQQFSVGRDKHPFLGP